MMPIGTSSFTVPDRRLGWEGRETGPIVVWLRGEHDLSTDDAPCATLARAIALDRAALVLDLSEVEFMAPSTLGVIARAREFLQGRSGSLTVRSPSARARRAMDACRLNDLLGPSPEMAGDEKGGALGTWVAVPGAPRDDGQTAPSPRAAEHVPVRAALAIGVTARGLSAEGPPESR
ncbi:MAG: STAS domain-containing protein [Acidimicrobiales bacterium]|jgi:anti-anti-sigma factor